MRPTQDELLATLRHSLNQTLVPALEDRWARYVATAMDLVLQHLQLRVTAEEETLSSDGADMAGVLAGLARRAADAGRSAEGAGDDAAASAWEELAAATVGPREPIWTTLESLTAHHEELRERVVGCCTGSTPPRRPWARPPRSRCARRCTCWCGARPTG